MVIYIYKQVTNHIQILIIYNNASIHNLKNINAININYYLINKYYEVFDKLYIEYKLQ